MFLNRAASVLKLAFGDYEIYRAGGDEFVVLCPDITQNIMEERITQLRALSDNTHDVSFSVGYVWLSGSYDINSAMRTADERMFKDKEEYYKLHAKNDRRIRVNAT